MSYDEPKRIHCSSCGRTLTEIRRVSFRNGEKQLGKMADRICTGAGCQLRINLSKVEGWEIVEN